MQQFLIRRHWVRHTVFFTLQNYLERYWLLSAFYKEETEAQQSEAKDRMDWTPVWSLSTPLLFTLNHNVLRWNMVTSLAGWKVAARANASLLAVGWCRPGKECTIQRKLHIDGEEHFSLRANWVYQWLV